MTGETKRTKKTKKQRSDSIPDVEVLGAETNDEPHALSKKQLSNKPQAALGDSETLTAEKATNAFIFSSLYEHTSIIVTSPEEKKRLDQALSTTLLYKAFEKKLLDDQSIIQSMLDSIKHAERDGVLIFTILKKLYDNGLLSDIRHRRILRSLTLFYNEGIKNKSLPAANLVNLRQLIERLTKLPKAERVFQKAIESRTDDPFKKIYKLSGELIEIETALTSYSSKTTDPEKIAKRTELLAQRGKIVDQMLAVHDYYFIAPDGVLKKALSLMRRLIPGQIKAPHKWVRRVALFQIYEANEGLLDYQGNRYIAVQLLGSLNQKYDKSFNQSEHIFLKFQATGSGDDYMLVRPEKEIQQELYTYVEENKPELKIYPARKPFTKYGEYYTCEEIRAVGIESNYSLRDSIAAFHRKKMQDGKATEQINLSWNILELLLINPSVNFFKKDATITVDKMSKDTMSKRGEFHALALTNMIKEKIVEHDKNENVTKARDKHVEATVNMLGRVKHKKARKEKTQVASSGITPEKRTLEIDFYMLLIYRLLENRGEPIVLKTLLSRLVNVVKQAHPKTYKQELQKLYAKTYESSIEYTYELEYTPMPKKPKFNLKEYMESLNDKTYMAAIDIKYQDKPGASRPPFVNESKENRDNCQKHYDEKEKEFKKIEAEKKKLKKKDKKLMGRYDECKKEFDSAKKQLASAKKQYKEAQERFRKYKGINTKYKSLFEQYLMPKKKLKNTASEKKSASKEPEKKSVKKPESKSSGSSETVATEGVSAKSSNEANGSRKSSPDGKKKRQQTGQEFWSKKSKKTSPSKTSDKQNSKENSPDTSLVSSI